MFKPGDMCIFIGKPSGIRYLCIVLESDEKYTRIRRYLYGRPSLYPARSSNLACHATPLEKTGELLHV